MRLLLTIAVLLSNFLLASCGQQGGATSLEVTLAALSTTGSGEVFLIAHNPTSNLYRRERLISDPQSIEIPNGTWDFYLVFYDGGITGTPRCDKLLQQKLDGVALGLSFNVKAANCLAEPFAKTTFIDSSAIQPLYFQTCAPSLPAVGTDCSGSLGVTQSYKIAMANITFSAATSLSTASTGFVSGCYTGVTGAGTNTNVKMISGSTAMPFPFTIKAYQTTDCSGAVTDFTFGQGLLTASSTSQVVYDYTTSAPDQSWLYLKHVFSGPALSAVINGFTIPAESAYPMTLSKFITGGQTPYTYTCTSCGSSSLTSGVLNNNGSTGSKVVTVTDALGSTVTLTMSAVTSSFHDFTSGATNGWSTSRTSANNFSASTLSSYSMTTANTARFWFPNASASQGLLIEPYHANLATNFAVLNSGAGYTTIGSLNNSNYIVVSPYSLSTSTRLDDTNTSSTSYLVSPSYTSLSGDYILSMYLKKNTAQFAMVYLADVASSCNSLVVDLNTGSSIDSSFCGAGQDHGVIDMGNGWYKVWLRENISSGQANFRIYPAYSNALTASEVVTATGSIEVWGVQFELGTYPATPIFTAGSSAASNTDMTTITSGTDASIFPQNLYGTMMLKWNSLQDKANASTLLHIYNTAYSTSNSIKLRKDAANKAYFDLRSTSSAVFMNSPAQLSTTDGENVAVLSFNSATMNLVVNNSSNVIENATGFTPGFGFNEMTLGADYGGLNASGMVAYRLQRWDAYFPKEVTQQMVAP